METGISIRPAVREDAPVLARLVDMAGEEMPRSIWRGMAEPGETIWDVGARRAGRDEGAFSYRNAIIAERGGVAAGGLLGYRIGPDPEPTDDLPDMFVPLQELENLACGAFYINVLAVLPEHRRHSLGEHLMRAVPGMAGGQGPYAIIVANRNIPAVTLYAREGFRETARRAIVEDNGWTCASEEWVLLVKP